MKKFYEFEMPIEGYVMIAVEAESQEEARRLLVDGEGVEEHQEVSYVESAADVPLYAIYTRDGNVVEEDD